MKASSSTKEVKLKNGEETNYDEFGYEYRGHYPSLLLI